MNIQLIKPIRRARNKTLLLLIVTATHTAGAQPLSGEPPAGRDDAAIYRQIDRLRRAAANLQLDGQDRDWRAMPQLTDPSGDLGRPDDGIAERRIFGRFEPSGLDAKIRRDVTAAMGERAAIGV